MKREINVFEHAGEILGAMRNGGMLLTTKLDDKVNTMTISWGTLGVVAQVHFYCICSGKSIYKETSG